MEIELKNGHVLTAYCRRPSGEATYSELNLDDFLGAKRGKHNKAAKTRAASESDSLARTTHHPSIPTQQGLASD